MASHRICSTSELPATNTAAEFVAGDTMVCVSNIDGEYSAINNVCGHRGGPLGQGTIFDGKIMCPLHCWLYDPKTGVPDMDPHYPVAVYKLRIEADDVFIDM